MSINGMNGLLSIAGVSSGINSTSIIQSLVDAQKAEETPLQNEISQDTAQINAWNGLSSYFSAFQSAVQTLANPSTWNQMTTTSTNDNIVTATTSSGATTGNYNITASSLAQGETLLSGSYSSATTPVNSSDVGGFTLTQASNPSSPISISITSTDTLQSIADKINSAASGANLSLEASVVTGQSGSQLAIMTTNTGSNSALTFSNVTGSALGLTSSTAEVQKPSDAMATINGVTATSSTNTFSNVVSGVSFTLNSTGTATVGVTQNTQSVMTAVNNFTDSYNKLIQAIQADAKIDTSNSANNGPLAGDYTLENMQNNLESAVGGIVGGSGGVTSLAQAGITLNSDGTLSFDSTTGGQTTFQNLMNTNMSGLQQMFGVVSVDGLTPTQGLTGQLTNLVNSVTDPTNGTIFNETQSLTTTNQQIQSQINQIDQASQQYQAMLEQQFNAMETSIAAMKAQGQWLSSFSGTSTTSTTSSPTTTG